MQNKDISQFIYSINYTNKTFIVQLKKYRVWYFSLHEVQLKDQTAIHIYEAQQQAQYMI